MNADATVASNEVRTSAVTSGLLYVIFRCHQGPRPIAQNCHQVHLALTHCLCNPNPTRARVFFFSFFFFFSDVRTVGFDMRRSGCVTAPRGEVIQPCGKVTQPLRLMQKLIRYIPRFLSPPACPMFRIDDTTSVYEPHCSLQYIARALPVFCAVPYKIS
jgi:hypothetical protein